jgi:outer membrane protein assembly factor BamB
MSLHALSFPSLEEIERYDIPFDVMARFYQINGSRFFKVSAQNTQPKNVYLNNDFHFVNQEKVPSQIKELKNQKIRVKFNKNNTLDIYTGSLIAHTLKFTLSDPPGWYHYVVFNNSKSIALFNSSTSELYFINDIANPSIIRHKQKIKFEKIFSDKNSTSIFITNYTRNKDHSLNIVISKLNIFKNSYESNFIEIKKASTRETIYKLIGGADLLIFGNEGKLYTYNANSGEPIHNIKVTEESLQIRKVFKNSNNTIVIVGQDVINITTGQIIGNLPGLYPIGQVKMSNNNEYILYSAPTQGIQITKLVCYSIETNKIISEIDLKNIGINPGYGKVHRIFFIENDHIIVLAGSAVFYPDHMHK